MDKVMMKCGHTANATHDGKPVCAICFGLTPDAEIVAKTEPDLTGIRAECRYCSCKADSNENLPFFEYRPKQKTDSFYCGCRGWD